MPVKELMSPRDGISWETPICKAVGAVRYGITFPKARKLFIPCTHFCLFCFIFPTDFHWILLYRVLAEREVHFTMNMDIFQLFFNYLEERPYNNMHQNVKQDADYLESMMLENKLNDQYQQLNLSDKQRKIILQWIDTIQAQESAYTAVIFRMGMQFSFSLLFQLADL